MTLLTARDRVRLLANGDRHRHQQQTDPEAAIDFRPVVKLFTPDAGATWLLTELDPDDPDLAFGLCDLGLGFPELGYVRLTELAAVRGRLGLPIERDRYLDPEKTLSAYAAVARLAGRITA
ncbi:MAG: DUF2958 domain-containing protein [Vicinamibacterales bacterium]